MTAPTPRADHAELAASVGKAIRDNIHRTSRLYSVRTGERKYGVGGHQAATDAVVAVCAPLLSEIAALRARHETTLAGECPCCVLTRAECADAIAEIEIGRTQAERQRDELREALQRMEWSCEQLAATRTVEVYDAMIQSGQTDALLELDNARRAARQALANQGADQ